MATPTRPGTILRRNRLLPVLRRLLDQPGKRILDVGGLDGLLGRELVDRYGCEYLGIDIDRAGLQRMVASGLPTAYASGLAIPQPSQSVDIVLLLDVIEHVYEHDQLLKEIARVLRPGGMLLLTTPILGAKLVPWIDMHKVHLGWDHHYREGYTFEEITTLAAAQGFQIVEYSTAFNFLSRWAYYAHFFMRGGRRLLAPRPALFALITHLEPLLPLAGLTHVFVLRSIETRCS